MTETDIISFIQEKAIEKNISINYDTSIQCLGINGDDAEDFITIFSSQFNVDITEFDYSKYFKPDFDLLSILRFFKLVSPKEKCVELTVKYLIESVSLGKLK